MTLSPKPVNPKPLKPKPVEGLELKDEGSGLRTSCLGVRARGPLGFMV